MGCSIMANETLTCHMTNEKRLIDANALLAELDKFANPMPNKSGYDFLCGMAAAITEIENAPTVDAVEVVRCKDCKHFNGVFGRCDNMRGLCISNPNEFCSNGERREGE